MRNLIVALVCFFVTGCAVKVKQCRPSVNAEVKPDCKFNKQNPTACLGVVWLKIKCPTENL